MPVLPNYGQLRESVALERKAIMRMNGLDEEDEDLVRSHDDALILFDFLSDLQTKLHEFFSEYPSLMSLFKREFIAFSEFIDRTNILETCFVYDCLFPEKELYYFGPDGGLSDEVLRINMQSMTIWMQNTLELHSKTQVLLKERFNLSLKLSELECSCVMCVGDYRTRLREFIFQECEDVVEETRVELESCVFDKSLNEKNHIYHEMQKKIEKTLYKVRNRLKRSTLNRLEVQIKNLIRNIFHYPSKLADKQVLELRKYFEDILREDELSLELMTDEEYSRFFLQISNNIWRGEKYLKSEFRKIVKSVMLLKRKDISAQILKDYLGEFWLYSNARQIKRKIIYHMGPTNSGKTYHAIQRLSKAENGCYLAPLRLLAGELYDTLSSMGVVTTLLTGEEVIEVEGATHYSSTIEMARFQENFECCVIDEIQMMTDPQRGWAWTRALVNIFADEIHLCGDPSVLDLVKQIVELCGDELEVREYERMTELIVDSEPVTLGELERSDALIVFSRKNALRYKADLERLDFRVSIVYGRLSPEVRREQARKFDEEETDIIVSTDAISMGMNLPIKRIVFSTLTKYINNQEHPISFSEIKQIAGRAGRFQRFPVGHVSCLSKVRDGLDDIKMAFDSPIEQQKQCMVGPDLDIINQVNKALRDNNIPELKLSEFLRLFNTMSFKKPFFCVDLKEMIELAEMVEESDPEGHLSDAEIFGFACAPVNLGLMDHVQYFVWIMNNFVHAREIPNEMIDFKSDDIDYLETSIKCVELYQWLSRHFNNKHFRYDMSLLLENKAKAVERLNELLSEKIVQKCSSCGVKLSDDFKFPICEKCFKQRRFRGRRGGANFSSKRSESGDGPSGEKKDFSKKKASRKFRPKRRRRQGKKK